MTARGPFDPEDTDWGKTVHKRLGRVEEQIDFIDTQIRELDMHVAGLRQDHTSMRQELKINTDQTNAIKGDTEWLVHVFKGSKALGPLFVGICVTAAALATFITWVASILHGSKP